MQVLTLISLELLEKNLSGLRPVSRNYTKVKGSMLTSFWGWFFMRLTKIISLFDAS